MDPADLDRISEEKVKEMIALRERKKNVPRVLVEIRMAHYDDKRKAKFKLIREVRYLKFNVLEIGALDYH